MGNKWEGEVGVCPDSAKGVAGLSLSLGGCLYSLSLYLSVFVSLSLYLSVFVSLFLYGSVFAYNFVCICFSFV